MFSAGFDVAADGGEGLDAVGGAPAAADSLMDFRHAEISFGLVIVERYGEVAGEGEDFGFVVEERAGEVRCCFSPV